MDLTSAAQTALQEQQLQNDFRFGLADLRSQRVYNRKNYQMGRDLVRRTNKYATAQQNDSLAERGLDFSGTQVGSNARSLEDLTGKLAQMGLDQKSQQDAIRRAIQKLRSDTALQQEQLGLQAMGSMSGGTP